ncbi:MAG: hypothetical protein GY722_01745 [bacterium]|nr:hypothetical protein [bacterium]
MNESGDVDTFPSWIMDFSSEVDDVCVVTGRPATTTWDGRLTPIKLRWVVLLVLSFWPLVIFVLGHRKYPRVRLPVDADALRQFRLAEYAADICLVGSLAGAIVTQSPWMLLLWPLAPVVSWLARRRLWVGGVFDVDKFEPRRFSDGFLNAYYRLGGVIDKRWIRVPRSWIPPR